MQKDFRSLFFVPAYNENLDFIHPIEYLFLFKWLYIEIPNKNSRFKSLR